MSFYDGCSGRPVKAEDQTKLALKISVIGVLMRKVDDAI
jgi:hypothetical protein